MVKSLTTTTMDVALWVRKFELKLGEGRKEREREREREGCRGDEGKKKKKKRKENEKRKIKGKAGEWGVGLVAWIQLEKWARNKIK